MPTSFAWPQHFAAVTGASCYAMVRPMSLESHDRSLKFLLARKPADFIRFGIPSATVNVLRPVESDLPVRDRDVDGGYLIQHDGQRRVAHVEFHRRHQDLTELALDV